MQNSFHQLTCWMHLDPKSNHSGRNMLDLVALFWISPSIISLPICCRCQSLAYNTGTRERVARSTLARQKLVQSSLTLSSRLSIFSSVPSRRVGVGSVQGKLSFISFFFASQVVQWPACRLLIVNDRKRYRNAWAMPVSAKIFRPKYICQSR